MSKKRLAVYGIASLLLALSGMMALYGHRLQQTIPAADAFSLVEQAETDTLIIDLTPMQVANLPLHELKPFEASEVDEETLWLARCIYSETKRPEEQVLVAWVIRNRVDTAYRGKATYQDVVLDPYQFSAFLPDHYKRSFYERLNINSTAPGWQRTLHIAHAVRNEAETQRPFSVTTRHFYSERSMPDLGQPLWIDGHQPVQISLEVDERRFRFYQDVS